MLENYRLLAKYNKWMNEKIYASASHLPDEERKRNYNAFFGSIHNTLNHLILTDKIWLSRFAAQGVNFPSLKPEILEIPGGFNSLNQVLFEDFDQLRKHRFEMDNAIENWVLEMPDDFPGQIMNYVNSKGIKREHPIWQPLTHFFNHQTHHRGQVTTLLFQAGVDPGLTDLIAMADSLK